MFKYAFLFTLLFAVDAANAQNIINYETKSQNTLNSELEGVMNVVVEDNDDFAELDLLAAEHGDVHAMGTLSLSCLNKADYACAYKWSGIALRGNYWRSVGSEDKIKEIWAAARTHLSEDEIRRIDDEIKNFAPRR